MKFDDSLDQLSESYLRMPSRRLFYPRNFRLSEDFAGAFSKEYNRLIDEGQDPKKLYERFTKALRFHVEKCGKRHRRARR